MMDNGYGQKNKKKDKDSFKELFDSNEDYMNGDDFNEKEVYDSDDEENS
jgi:hypothetical protein